MDCCSTPNAAQIDPEVTQQIDQTTNHLADLLTQMPEYQEFIRLARLINLDPDVRRLSQAIRNQKMYYADPQGKPAEALQDELESLPAVQAYRKAEGAVRSLLKSVDQIISSGAGVAFAENAVKSGCG